VPTQVVVILAILGVAQDPVEAGSDGVDDAPGPFGIPSTFSVIFMLRMSFC
jgi:hypothetical protein